jgi:hypothetical protein
VIENTISVELCELGSAAHRERIAYNFRPFGAGSKWSHRIDPHIDRERDWVETDLFFVGTAEAYAEVDRPNALRTLSNATGDQIVTEGKISVVQLATSKGRRMVQSF